MLSHLVSERFSVQKMLARSIADVIGIPDIIKSNMKNEQETNFSRSLGFILPSLFAKFQSYVNNLSRWVNKNTSLILFSISDTKDTSYALWETRQAGKEAAHCTPRSAWRSRCCQADTEKKGVEKHWRSCV